MPSKRDARNNTAPSEFAYLGLHQAALSGNIGLVQYALSQGQPVDAVWDGISALHAAAAGGSEHVARLLVESGADVSFGRLPRNEREIKARTVSSPSSTALDKGADSPVSRIPRGDLDLKPRTSSASAITFPDALLNAGSTPLHFACAHNHVSVARVLLSYGAAPHIRDRSGVTPLDLLPPASPDSSSDLLRTVIREYYEAEKAKEKELQKNHIRFHGKAAAVLGFPREEEASSSRIGVKLSRENLLSKSPKHIPAPLTGPALSPNRRAISSTGTPPPSPRRPSGHSFDRNPPSPTSPSRFTFGTATPGSHTNSTSTPQSAPPDSPQPSTEQRRPSLPHLFDDSSPSPPASTNPPRNGHRPRSAGSGSQSSQSRRQPSSASTASYTFNTARHSRPRTKRSLLSLFKKGEYAASDMAADAEQEREVDKDGVRMRHSSTAGSKSAPLAQSVARRRGSGLSQRTKPLTEVRTAPAERTSFATRGGHVAGDVFDDDDFDGYGIPLVGSPNSIPQELPESPMDTEDEESDGEFDEEETVEDGARDPSLELDRASTGATVRPGDHFVPPPHAEAWYRDRMESARAAGRSLGQSESDPSSQTWPRPRPGILRNEWPVRHTSSKSALRFEAQEQDQDRQEGRAQLREKGSHGSFHSVESRPRLQERPRTISASRTVLGPSEGKNDHLAVDSRMRGDSVSSASTDASAPARSNVSQDTTTATTASISSVPPLPDNVRVGESYGDALLDSSEGEDEGHALGLNIRTVSNHAQAEALVQKAAKEFLELNSGVMDAEPSPNLSAQLAAYGETLQLERRFARGEAQRYETKTRIDGEGVSDEDIEQKREDERLRKTQEKMVWSQREMERYARDREGMKEKKGLEMIYDKEALRVGVPLARTASLEKELEVGAVNKRPAKSRPEKIRRPHTSDSVGSSVGGPPRFGHTSTHSSSSFLRGNEGVESMRAFGRERRGHHPLRSVSAHPRAESLDYDRPKSSPRESEPPIPAARHDSPAEPDMQPSPTAMSKPSPVTTSRSHFNPPTLVDEFGASTGSIRPTKQRFGGLLSLFKSK